MSTRQIEKHLAGQEDLLYGEGTVTQNRAGTDYTITKNRVAYPVNTEAELGALDTSKFVKAVLFDTVTGIATHYAYSSATSTWVRVAAHSAAHAVEYTPAGTGAVTTTVESKLRESVSVKDFGAIGDGIADDTAAIQAAIDASPGKRLTGIGGETYRITSRLNIRDLSNVDIDFGGATLLDEVEGTDVEFGGAPSALVLIRECSHVTFSNFRYDGANRTNTASLFFVFRIGVNAGSNLWESSNDNKNYNITVENVTAINGHANGGMFGVLGNSHNVVVQNIALYGDFRVGINTEYSLAPYDDYNAVQPQYAGIEDRYGVHAFNVVVRNFVGYDNTVCQGFLRTAGVYNVKYENCYGYNVSNFIYNYSGDRSIYRIGQSCVYDNCSSFASESNVALTGNIVTVLATEDDGSTAEPLPSWTKYDFKIIFNACEFQGNKLANGVRYIGNDGSTVFNACTFRDCAIGLRMGGSTGAWVDNPETALTLNDCIFTDNDVDAYVRAARRTTFNSCQFKGATGTVIPVQFTDCDYVKFDSCKFSGLINDNFYVDIDASSSGAIFENCGFSDQLVFASIRSVSAITGFNNVNFDTALTHVGAGYSQSSTQESNSWTPVLTGSVSGSIAGTGKYTRIGNAVHFNGFINYSNDFSVQGTVTITGLPFATALSDQQIVTLGQSRFALSTGYGFFATVNGPGSSINLYETFSGTTIHAAITQANLSASSIRIWVSGTYLVN